MTSLKLTTTLVFAAVFTASSAYAQEGGNIAAGIGVTPEYEGSPDQHVIPFLAARFQSGGHSIALEGLALRADLLGSDTWEAGPVATYTFGRDKDVETIASRLDVIADAVELGAYAARTWSDGVEGGRWVRLAVQAVKDITNVHEGWILAPSVSVSRALSDRLQVSTELSANLVSDEYAQTYFGVTDNRSVTGISSYRSLLSDAADSPLVDRIGDANQFTMGIGIGHSF